MTRKYIGHSVEKLPTPALIVDLDAVEQNIHTMQTFVDRTGIHIRPHIKTHKSIQLAKMQRRAGCEGICCATVEEVVAMSNAGFGDILLANEIVSKSKIQTLVDLYPQTNVMFIADSLYGVQQIESVGDQTKRSLPILLDLDTGMGRCGVRDVDVAVSLVEYIHKSTALRFEGIMAYNGKNAFMTNPAAMQEACDQSYDIVLTLYNRLNDLDIPINIVSVAGTGNYQLMGIRPIVTEIQSGSYIFSDATYEQVNIPFRPALFILATVISLHDGVFILDGGSKTISTDMGLPTLWNLNDRAEIVSLSEEHVVCRYKGDSPVAVGDRIWILPSHCCTTNFLHSEQYAVRNRLIVDIYDIIGR